MSTAADRAREYIDKREYLEDDGSNEHLTIIEDLLAENAELRKANASSAAMFDEIAPALARSAAQMQAANQLGDLSQALGDQAGLLAPPQQDAIEASSEESG